MEITPLSGALGAEVRGIDLADLDAAGRSAVQAAYDEYLMLVFPGQDLSAAEQVAFTEMFGPVEPHPLRTRRAVDGFPEVLIIENRPGRPGARNDYWHSDISHAERPPSASVLHALTIPEGLGDTLFCSMVRVHDGLSDGMRRALDGRRALHSGMATYTRSLEHSAARGIDPAEIAPPRPHPVIRTHAETGQRALFVNPHFTTGLEGMSDAESDAILAPLYAAATAPENVYRHRWRVGDVVVWDNRRTMHYAVRDYTDETPRKMHRTTAGGEVPV